jgi:cell division protein FtsL
MATARVVDRPSARPLPDLRRRERERHLRVVHPDRRRLNVRLSPRAGVALTVLLFVALFGVAVSHAVIIEGQASVDSLDQRVAAEQARYEELRQQVAELESPQRILGEATEELGMVPAGEKIWLTPDEPAPTGTTEPPPESPDTSAARVKPYLEPAP